MSKTRLKVASADLLARVLDAQTRETMEYEAALVQYGKELSAWEKAAQKVLAATKTLDGLDTKEHYVYGNDGREYVTFLQIEVPDKPKEPQSPRGGHDKIIRLLQATTQSEITVSTDDDLYRYL